MFYDTQYSLWQMALIWTVVTGLWAVSLCIALKLGHIELNLPQQAAVVILSGLSALVPVIGLFLAPLVSIYLICRMADAEIPIIVTVVVLTRFIAAIVGIGAERGMVALGILRG